MKDLVQAVGGISLILFIISFMMMTVSSAKMADARRMHRSVSDIDASEYASGKKYALFWGILVVASATYHLLAF
jgi:hypothetical protein